MMRIFYIDWRPHWEYDRTMDIGANAHGKPTVSTKQPQVTDFTSVSPKTVGLPVTSERYWACFQVTRLFHSATIFAATYVFAVWNFPGLSTRWKIFFTSIWWGSTQLQCIYYLRLILISRPPRVFWRFKHRSCFIYFYLFIYFFFFGGGGWGGEVKVAHMR